MRVLSLLLDATILTTLVYGDQYDQPNFLRRQLRGGTSDPNGNGPCDGIRNAHENAGCGDCT